LVAGFFNKSSASAEIIKLIERGELKCLWTEAVKKEAEMILKQIPPIKEGYVSKIQNIIFQEKNKVKDPPKLDVISADPEDNKLLACAKAGNADYLISNDKHLLNHNGYKGIKVLKSSEFIKIFK
jgi:putative PIN family toxin of toxin-antitoxin system